MIKKILYLTLVLFIIQACNNEEKKAEKEVPNLFKDEGFKEISKETMEGLIDLASSSPIEMATLIKESDVPFSKDYLATTDNIDKLATSYDQAIHLGIYSADLGYINMYNKTGMVIGYISAIKGLADDLKVGHFFNFGMLKSLALNSTDLDSLMYISVSSFNKMDSYLRENNRSNISTLLVTGVWIEGLYLATQVLKNMPNDRIAERIGEQKIMVDNLILVLSNFDKDKRFASLKKDFMEIKKRFKDVRITIEKGEPEMVEENGMLVIKQNEKSTVHITDEQLNEIIDITAKVRNKILNK